MPKVIKIKKRVLVIAGRVFNIGDITKAIKKGIEDQGLIFVENEQNFKEDQYGQQIGFNMSGFEELDEFANLELAVVINFKNIQKVKKGNKTLDKGGLELLFIPKVTYDYKNNWGKNKFSEFWFNIWIDFFKDADFKPKYLKASQKKVDAIYAAVKKVCDYYQ